MITADSPIVVVTQSEPSDAAVEAIARLLIAVTQGDAR